MKLNPLFKEFFTLPIREGLGVGFIVSLSCCLISCNNNANQTSSENDSLSVADSSATALVEEEPVDVTVGEKAFFQVHGDVKTIEIVSGCQFHPNCEFPEIIKFDEKGISMGLECEKTKNTGDSLYIWFNYISEFDSFGSTLIYVGGRLVEQYGLEWCAKFEYDNKGRIIKEETMGDCDEYTATFVYDKDGNCVERTDGSKTVTYEIVETDSHRNWTKRISSEGDIDERVITYFE